MVATPGLARRSSVVQFLAANNPFYVLSAMCMLFGIFALNGSLDWSPMPRGNLLLLIGTLNLYEWLLIGLGVLLVRNRIVRDAIIVLLIEAFFLVDAGFLGMEVFTVDPRYGLAVNIVLAFLALAKVGVLLWAIGLRDPAGLLALTMAQIVLLLGIPGVFASIAGENAGWLDPLAVYGAWWIAALVPILACVLIRPAEMLRAWPGHSSLQRVVVRTLVVLPMVSLIAHLSLLSWVHKTPFYLANVAPMLLGLAVFIGRFERHEATKPRRMNLQLALPLAAMFLSAVAGSRSLYFELLGVDLSPLSFALLGAFLVYLDGLWVHRHLYFLAASIMCFTTACLGATLTLMHLTLFQAIRGSFDLLSRLIPKTLTAWGILSVIASFILLAAGALVSFLKPRVAREPETVTVDPL